MKYEWIDTYCLSKRGVTKDFKEQWGWHRYLIGGKMFAAVCTHQGQRPIVTLKCEPSFGDMLRHGYEDIIPGYYMNKEHWNSVYMDGGVPDEVVMEMVDMSYRLVFGALTKTVQREIDGGNHNG